MSDRKVVRIELEYADGEIIRAVGEDADRIWASIQGMTVLESIHGRPYSGPQMKPVGGARMPEPDLIRSERELAELEALPDFCACKITSDGFIEHCKRCSTATVAMPRALRTIEDDWARIRELRRALLDILDPSCCLPSTMRERARKALREK